MEWGHFFTIIAQILIVVTIGGLVAFFGSALAAAIYSKMKGK